MLAYTDLYRAFGESYRSKDFKDVRYGGGWNARLEREYETSYKATLWNDGHGLCIRYWFTASNVEQASALAARYMKLYHDNELWPKTPAEKVRDWYQRTCPTDELGDLIDCGVTFAMYLIDLACGNAAYIYGIDDSIVRQRVMAATAHVMGLEYNAVYDLWRV